MIRRLTVIKCPHCGFFRSERMTAEVCVVAWKCPSCDTIIHPHAGECCIYCSHASVPCPRAQHEFFFADGAAPVRGDEHKK